MVNNRSTILASLAQSGRAPSFQIITQIIENDGHIRVFKRALNKESASHLKAISKNYTLLSTMLTSAKVNASVSKILDQKENSVEFEYIQGKNCDEILLSHIINGSGSDYRKLIDTIFYIFDQLSTPPNNKTKNDPIFNIDWAKYPTSTPIMSPAIIDFNFDNFIYGKSLSIIDYEWILDTSIPIQYIKTRSLWTFFVRYYDTLRFLPTQKNTYHEISAYGQKALVPSDVYKEHRELFSKKSLKNLFTFEQNFQAYVNKTPVSKITDPIEHTVTVVSAPHPTLQDQYLHNGYEIRELLDSISKLNSDIEWYKRENEDMKMKLKSIENSKGWRLLEKSRSVKRKISR